MRAAGVSLALPSVAGILAHHSQSCGPHRARAKTREEEVGEHCHQSSIASTFRKSQSRNVFFTRKVNSEGINTSPQLVSDAVHD